MVHLCTVDSIARRDLHSFSHWHPTYAIQIAAILVKSFHGEGIRVPNCCHSMTAALSRRQAIVRWV